MKNSKHKQTAKTGGKAAKTNTPNRLLIVALLLVAAAAALVYFLTQSPNEKNPGPQAFFCAAKVKGVAAEQIDPQKMIEYDYTLERDSCSSFTAYLDETAQANTLGQDEARKKVCDEVQEALISSMISVEKFSEIQYIITGDTQKLRAYNMDVYTANCDAP